jgi:iron(III) transport system ATP-binding protein
VSSVHSVSAGYLDVSKLSKKFGEFDALSDVTFGISEGEFICFLGPSGCGKTTLLRCIAGLETQSAGSIRLAGSDISWRPPSERDFGIVFQSYALFPNLTVAQNVGFGLVSKKHSKQAIAARVAELLALVDLQSHAQKYPGQLSGGEQQRVALVRALAPAPGLLLLDEPLSALDAKVRARLRREIRAVQNRLGVTTIMVTHDQEEAQTMADRIFVMNAGRIEQMGTPSEIYDAPATPFVADFIGVMNFLAVEVSGANEVRCGDYTLQCDTDGRPSGQALALAIRPEDVLISQSHSTAPNQFQATIQYLEPLGSFVRIYLNVKSLTEEEIRVDVRKDTARTLQLDDASDIRITLPTASLRLYSRDRAT